MAGSPEEHFLSKPGETWEQCSGAPSRDAYVERVLQQNTGPNGVFGAIVMWSYFERMLQMLQEIPEYKDLTGAQLLEAVFCKPKYIWMRRRNRVEQAVSCAIASQTGVRSQTVGAQPRPQATPKFNFKIVDEWYNRIAAHETSWTNYFSQQSNRAAGSLLRRRRCMLSDRGRTRARIFSGAAAASNRNPYARC